MIYIYNFIISIICLIPIVLFISFPELILANHFKNHMTMFIIKLLFISMFICFFIFNFSIQNYKIFIISGYINFTIFHTIEGFVTQKIISKNENKN